MGYYAENVITSQPPSILAGGIYRPSATISQPSHVHDCSTSKEVPPHPALLMNTQLQRVPAELTSSAHGEAQQEPNDEDIEVVMQRSEDDHQQAHQHPDLPDLSRAPPRRKYQEKWNGDLPRFSISVSPLLSGEPLDGKMQARLSLQLKDEILSYLDQHDLITEQNSAERRWMYASLGNALAERYPHLMWDKARAGTKRGQTMPRNVWSVFMQRLSTMRKMRRRVAAASALPATVEVTPAVKDLTPDDALRELEAIEEAVKDKETLNIPRIKELLAATFRQREKKPVDFLPVYFLHEDCVSLPSTSFNAPDNFIASCALNMMY
ncbi:uncharacterized protein LOC135375897 [Ornithodoros turicata]|uniref:uncharacterized protein LOC135375897 n=1 Tax=Ornithodoros turicata TaxID=34597 RepID=UPI00313A3367